MRDPAIHDALLVGVGPAGAALGLVLARRGLRVTALERHADFSREFRGEGLQQSGYRVLQELLGADVERLPTRRFTEIQLAFGPRVVRGSVRGADLEHMRLVPQPPLLELLTERAARYPGYRLERGVVVRDLIVEDGRVVGVRATGPDGPRELRARLVIGVDGRSSIVRKRLAIELDLLAQRFDVLWARGDLGELMPADCAHAEVLREGGLVIAFHSPAGGQQIGVIIEKGGYRRLRDQGEAASLGWVRERCSPRTAAALAGDVGKPVLLDVICGRARRWSAPGALLLGDAAHPMSPVGAQGINMALRDVIVAANHL
ncbi:MAG: FAD-dependent monooxygenase, partial [Myxococcales bacterium]|nr:FAD-dependent monooxygenase [Myxococcales bacterium]